MKLPRIGQLSSLTIQILFNGFDKEAIMCSKIGFNVWLYNALDCKKKKNLIVERFGWALILPKSNLMIARQRTMFRSVLIQHRMVLIIKKK